jgi:hypothetical protein
LYGREIQLQEYSRLPSELENIPAMSQKTLAQVLSSICILTGFCLISLSPGCGVSQTGLATIANEDAGTTAAEDGAVSDRRASTLGADMGHPDGSMGSRDLDPPDAGMPPADAGVDQAAPADNAAVPEIDAAAIGSAVDAAATGSAMDAAPTGSAEPPDQPTSSPTGEWTTHRTAEGSPTARRT